MIIYIAGKVTGDPLYIVKFAAAQRTLAELGYTVLNPGTLPYGMPGEAYMPICIAMLEQADGIALLPDYIESPGATAELAYARCQRKKVCYIVGNEFKWEGMKR